MYDVIVIGAGAAGMMTAIEAAKRGKKVLILEKTNRAGKKILMSGGGRCNFTNIHTSPKQYISHNPHFCKSALSRYTPSDFIALVQQYKIPYYEKTLGQLFCRGKSQEIVDMLLEECRVNDVEIYYSQTITSVEKNDCFKVISNQKTLKAHSLVVATGGLSIPTLGSSPFGYQLAEQFGLRVYPTRAGLVPLTMHPEDKTRFNDLSGIAVPSKISCEKTQFEESMLFTHRGLSGPSVLQISSYWHPQTDISIQFLPDIDWSETILNAKQEQPNIQLKNWLHQFLPKKLIDALFLVDLLAKPLKQLMHKDMDLIIKQLTAFRVKPAGTEGYRTAEVTLGGIDCDELSSKTMEAKKVPGLYFVGELIDVTGWLGGYNFQWAWASGFAAGNSV